MYWHFSRHRYLIVLMSGVNPPDSFLISPSLTFLLSSIEFLKTIFPFIFTPSITLTSFQISFTHTHVCVCTRTHVHTCGQKSTDENSVRSYVILTRFVNFPSLTYFPYLCPTFKYAWNPLCPGVQSQLPNRKVICSISVLDTNVYIHQST